MKEKSIDAWINSKGHLPSFLKLGDKGDEVLFDFIWRFYGKNMAFPSKISWKPDDGRVFIVEYFLKFCAEHGYVIKKSSAKICFDTLADSEDFRVSKEGCAYPNYLAWRERLEYLPWFLKDFHDQKDFFKSMFDSYGKDDNLNGLANGKISWVDGQIFVIDFFLWFLAKYGYVLRRSNHKFDFKDLEKTLSEMDKIRRETFYGALGLNKSSN